MADKFLAKWFTTDLKRILLGPRSVNTNQLKQVIELPISHYHLKGHKLRGSFQKFCTRYVFSLKRNSFHKIHLQSFNVISIVVYHSGQTFGQVLYSCQDAFVVNASDYSGHLIRRLLNASVAFPTEWFLQFCEQVKGWWAYVRTLRRVGKHFPSILFQNFRSCT